MHYCTAAPCHCFLVALFQSNHLRGLGTLDESFVIGAFNQPNITRDYIDSSNYNSANALLNTSPKLLLYFIMLYAITIITMRRYIENRAWGKVLENKKTFIA